MPCKTFFLAKEEDTLALGRAVGRWLYQSAKVVFLHGELGAGKTTLVRGLLTEIGFSGSVKSPTYTLVEPYELADRCVYHFDLYRLSDPDELEFLGVDEYLTDNDSLCIIEWPDKGVGWLPEPDAEITLDYHKLGGRTAKVSASKRMLDALQPQRNI